MFQLNNCYFPWIFNVFHSGIVQNCNINKNWLFVVTTLVFDTTEWSSFNAPWQCWLKVYWSYQKMENFEIVLIVWFLNANSRKNIFLIINFLAISFLWIQYFNDNWKWFEWHWTYPNKKVCTVFWLRFVYELSYDFKYLHVLLLCNLHCAESHILKLKTILLVIVKLYLWGY